MPACLPACLGSVNYVFHRDQSIETTNCHSRHFSVHDDKKVEHKSVASGTIAIFTLIKRRSIWQHIDVIRQKCYIFIGSATNDDYRYIQGG